MHIYQLQQTYNQLLNEIIENDGEIINPELLEQIEKEFETKSINYCYMIKQIESESRFIEEEILRLEKLKQQKENLIKRINYIFEPMFKQYGTYKKTPTGIEKWKIDLNTFVVEVENKIKTELNSEIEIDLPSTIYKLDISKEKYDTLPKEYKELATLKTKHNTKTTIEEMLQNKQKEVEQFINSMGDTREEEIKLNELIAEIKQLQNYLVFTQVKQIKIK